MFGSAVLDIVIGLVFVYWLLSAFCSAIAEAIAARLNLRSRGLEKAVRQLLGDPSGVALAKDFFEHPLINGLRQRTAEPKPNDKGPGEPAKNTLPSYIPSRTFVLTVFDLLVAPDSTKSLTIAQLRSGIAAALQTKDDTSGKYALAKALLPLLQNCGEDLETLRKMTEEWFDDSMNRLTGWYKAHSQLIIRIAAAVVVIAINADTLMLVRKLSNDPALRAAIVKQATEKVSAEPKVDEAARDMQGTDPPEPYGEDYWMKQVEKADTRVKDIGADLNALGLLGWNLEKANSVPAFGKSIWEESGGTVFGLMQKGIGLFLTVLAVSLGAPFWFELLNRLINIRSTGPKPAPTNENENARRPAKGTAKP